MEAAFAGNLNERLWDHMSDFLFDEVFLFLIRFVWLLVCVRSLSRQSFVANQTEWMSWYIYKYM